jgi:hypothetical protein
MENRIERRTIVRNSDDLNVAGKRQKFEEIDIEKDLVKLVIDLAMEYGQNKEGSFFIITSRSLRPYYSWLYTNILENTKVNVKSKRMLPLVKKLAELDGAVIIDDKGFLVAYGAQINRIKKYRGHGTRHSAALGISTVPGTLAIISSEEDGAVRIFRNGVTLVEINPFTQTPPTLSEKVADLVTSSSLPLIGSGGLAALALGVNPFMAAIVFTGSYIMTKSGAKSLGEFLRLGPRTLKEGEK